jgi:hypothetical protein
MSVVRFITGIAIVAITICGSFAPILAQDNAREETIATMRSVFAMLTKVYGYSLDPESFENRANREEIMKSLRSLVTVADQLEAHGGGLDPSFEYLRRSLARDAHDALARFEAGQYVGSRWVLNRITENCVTCHGKRRSDSTFDLGAEFMRSVTVRDMPPKARVDLEIATRQFDRALDTYEGLFADPKMSPQSLSLIGAFGNYIRLCVVVRNDPVRALKTLAKYHQRKDVPAHTKTLIEGWIRALEKKAWEKGRKDPVAFARKTIHNAQRSRRYPTDQPHLVDVIATTGVLHDYLSSAPDDKHEVAEAYYLLAIAESYITRSYWISETDLLLEQAIRTAPKSDIADDAYAFLVDYTTSGHSHMARGVPEDVESNLEELRKLVSD